MATENNIPNEGFAAWLQPVVEIAKQAGGKIMQIYASDDVRVDQKQDNSPLTAADMAAHHAIVERLQKLSPDVPILSEESRQIPYQERSAWSLYWLVDPLDGTKEFINKNGEFTVNIALIQHGIPVLGVVHVPAQDRTYFACQGNGSFRQDADGEAQAIRVRAHQPEKTFVVGSRSHRGASLDAMLDKLADYEMLAMGSSLKFCLVAEGKADIYPRLGPTSEWDTAAAQCVVEQAGGKVTDLSMQALRYNTKDSLLNPHFLVIADVHYDWSPYFEPQ